MTSLLYVQVLRNISKGFWEIDLDSKKALFRDNSHKLQPGEQLHDWHSKHTTIMDFLRENFKMKYVKEIIPDVKYVYSNDVICSWFTDGVVSHDPNRKLHCNREAVVYRNGQPFCADHSNTGF
jgi:hypothetical protein